MTTLELLTQSTLKNMKQEIRERILERRDSLTPKEVLEKSKKITNKLEMEPAYRDADIIMFYVSKDIYAPKGKEVYTLEAIKSALAHGKRVIVPKVKDTQHIDMLCCEISSFDELRVGHYGILEPETEKICPVEEINLVIVPGVAFDKSGHRIGYGKGYYDKLLKDVKAPKIALAYDFQIVDKIPANKWDVKVDKVITN